MNAPERNRNILYAFLILILTPIHIYSETTHCMISETLILNDDLTSKAAVSIRGLSARATLKSALPWKGSNPRENLTMPTWSVSFAPVPEIVFLCGAISRGGTPARLTKLSTAELASTITISPSISGMTRTPVLSLGSSNDAEFVGVDFSGKSWKAVAFASPTKFRELPSWLQLTKTSPPGNTSIFRYSVTAFSGIAYSETRKDQSWILGENAATAAPILLPGAECVARVGPVSAGVLVSTNLGALARPTGAVKADFSVGGKRLSFAGSVFFSGDEYTELDGDGSAVSERVSVAAEASSPPIGSWKTKIDAKAGTATERPIGKSLGLFPGRVFSGNGMIGVETRFFREETAVSAEPEKTTFAERITIPQCGTRYVRLDLSGKTILVNGGEKAPELTDTEGRVRIRITAIGPLSAETEACAKRAAIDKPTLLGASAKISFRVTTAAAEWNWFLSGERAATARGGMSFSAGVTAGFP